MIRKEVQDLISTYKHWVYSFMSHGGIEHDNEFNISFEALHQWLRYHVESDDADLSHNAVILEEYLIKTLMKHKDRWYFPRRKNKMSLGERVTSRLEAIFGGMKHKSSQTVQPNNTFFQSVKI